MICEGTNKAPPIYVQFNEQGEYERLNVTRDEKGQLRGGYVAVAREHIDGICADGQAMSASPRPTVALAKRGNDRAKGYVEPQSSVPASFTIATYYAVIFGNFWVPALLPSGHHAHLGSYNLTANNFANATTLTHFVNSYLTASDNFVNYFHGKGHIFGPNIAGSGSAQGLTCNPTSVVSETWLVPSSIPNIVWHAGSGNNTCSPAFFAHATPYKIFAGANDSQENTFWLYNNGETEPFFKAATVNSYESTYIAGQAGVAFLVANVYPLPVSEYWTINFTNVNVWTQP